MNAPIQSVLVVGPAPDAPLAALTLKRRHPELAVRQLLLPGSPDPAGEATTPLFLQHLSGALGLGRADIHRFAKPLWTLGFRMLWGRRGSFVRAFDSRLSTPPAEGFRHNAGFHAIADGPDLASLGGALIAAGHVFPKDRSRSVRLLENITGLQLRPGPLHELLMRGCRAVGVETTHGSIASVEASAAGVDAIVLEDGTRLEADLYGDLSGPDARILAATDGSRFEPESSAAFCTRAWTAIRRRGSEKIRPCTTIETVDAGWRWRVEHDDTIGFGLAYHPDTTSDDDALQLLLDKVGEPLAEPVRHQWTHGRQSRPWSANVVALGDAAGCLPPLAGMRLPGIVFQLHWLSRLLGETNGRPGEQSRALYHRTQSSAWHEMRDFLSIHHRFNTVSGSPYWTAAREAADPGSCRTFLGLFETGGPSGLLEQALPVYPSTLGFDTWLSALVGLGVPCAHLPELAGGEVREWQALAARWAEQARAGATPETCLEAIRKQVAPQGRAPDPIF